MGTRASSWFWVAAVAVVVFAAGFCVPGACLAKGENDPILCIDTGGHKALIRDVVFTKDGKYLVSASDDKTIRVWDVGTGEVRRTIRGRIGDGAEGKIYAMTLSPDNQWLAAGGWLAGSLEDTRAIRLYHFPMGRLTGLLKGHGDVVLSLAFSPDGKYLASGSGDFTVRVWDVGRMAPVSTLEGHKDAVYALAWLPDGRRLVSGALERDLILWDALSGERLKTLSGHENVVRAAAVSPDGRYIASGSWDKTVRLWDGRTGEFVKVLARLDSEPASLSFSPAGDALLTGVGAGAGNDCHIVEVPGGRKRLTFSRHDNIVPATAFSPDGRLAATGGGDNNLIHVWNARTGEVLQTMEGAGKIVWAAGFSADGDRIAWGNSSAYKEDNHRGPLEHAVRISGGRVSDLGSTGDSGSWVRGRSESGGVRLETAGGGPYGYENAVLRIVKNGRETARIERDSTSGNRHNCYTIAPDGNTVASGGSHGQLTLYRASDGQKIHDLVGHTGDVWAVAASPDGKYLVSGSADQTVRLWNVATGENILSVFRGSDGEWVAWTRSGYYTASPGGDRYIGWQINKGPDENPEYYAASQFAEILYRPDIVEAVVKYGSEEQALALSGATGAPDAGDIASMAPPEIRILRPEDGFIASADSVQLEVKIGGRVSDIRDFAVYVNGAQVLSPKEKRIGDLRGDTVQKFLVPLKDEVNLVKVVASNSYSATAEDVVKVLRAMAAGSKKPTGDLYFLAAGVNRLENIAGNDLDFPAQDAADMAALMEKTKGKLFSEVHVHLLSDLADKKPYRGNIEDALYQIKDAGIDDTVIVFLSGHGVSTEDGDFVFVTREAKRYENGEYQPSSVLNWNTIREVVRKVNARIVVLLDTCYSGSVDVMDLFNKAKMSSKIVVLTSSKSNEASLEYKDLGNGAFTHAIKKALALENNLPADSNKDGEVTLDELFMFVRGEVKNVTSGRQTPDLFSPTGIPDLAVFGK